MSKQAARTVTTVLIEKIKELPNTQVQDNSTVDGLGAIVIYETRHNGCKSQSIWLGRESTEDKLVDYIAERRIAARATGAAA